MAYNRFQMLCTGGIPRNAVQGIWCLYATSIVVLARKVPGSDEDNLHAVHDAHSFQELKKAHNPFWDFGPAVRISDQSPDILLHWG